VTVPVLTLAQEPSELRSVLATVVLPETDGNVVLQGVNWALFEEVAQFDQPLALEARTCRVRVVPGSVEQLLV